MWHLAEVLRHDGVYSMDKRHLMPCWRMSLFLLDTLPQIQKGLLSSKQTSGVSEEFEMCFSFSWKLDD